MTDDDYVRKVEEIEDPDDGVTYVNSIVKVGTKWCGPCKRAQKWMEQIVKDNREFTHVSFYTVDAEEYDTVKYSVDRMLTPRVAKVKSFPTFLVYHNNRLVSIIEGWDEKKLRDVITIKLTPINQQVYMDNSHMNEVVKKRHERSTAAEREGKPLEEQEPFNVRKALTDQKAILDSLSRR